MEERALCATGMPPVHAQAAKPWAGPGRVPTALSVPFGSCGWSWCLDSLAGQRSVSTEAGWGEGWVGDKREELSH